MADARQPPADYASEDFGLTVKQRILDRIEEKLIGITDGGLPIFREVHWGDLDGLGNESLPVAGIDYGVEEQLQIEFPCQRFRVPVFIYWRFRGERGVVEQKVYEYYLGLLKKAILPDNNADNNALDGLALNVEEESNTHSIIGIEDTYPGGSLTVFVTYRTRLHDPYRLPWE